MNPETPKPEQEEEGYLVTGETTVDFIGQTRIPIQGLRIDTFDSPESQEKLQQQGNKIGRIMDFAEEKGLHHINYKVVFGGLMVVIGSVALGLEHKRGWHDFKELKSFVPTIGNQEEGNDEEKDK